ncbi:MAG: hypothetical protein JW699_01500 [Chitinispirillaceae bacterium]|nr:hypothetical protein [Chitinispirillaceae bacterium]
MDTRAMNEQQETPPQKPTGDEIRKSIEAEIREMEKYKWCLGVQLRHDPLQDRSLNDIYTEWIEKYAAGFRKEWEDNKSKK